MKLNRCGEKWAFTLTELLITLLVLVVILWCVLPIFRPYHGAPRIACQNNLKQDDLAFRLWAQDHNDKFPSQVSMTNEGAMEAAWKGDLPAVFRVMSNELNTPKILVCPSDRSRSFATNFSEEFSAANISYFFSLDATETNPAALLTGDANLTGLSPVGDHTFELRLGETSCSWDRRRHVLHYEHQIFGYNYGPIGCGNVALCDGSVQTLSNEQLEQAWLQSGMSTNRLLMP